MDQYWNYILASLDVVGLAALRAVGKKMAVGWLWAMLTQAVWIIYSIATFQWGFLLVAVVKFAVYTWNWQTWAREGRKELELCNSWGGSLHDGSVRLCDKPRHHDDSHTYEIIAPGGPTGPYRHGAPE